MYMEALLAASSVFYSFYQWKLFELLLPSHFLFLCSHCQVFFNLWLFCLSVTIRFCVVHYLLFIIFIYPVILSFFLPACLQLKNVFLLLLSMGFLLYISPSISFSSLIFLPSAFLVVVLYHSLFLSLCLFTFTQYFK